MDNQAVEPKSVFTCYIDFFRKYFNFKGRTSRYEYWSFMIIHTFISLTLTSIDQQILDYFPIFSTIYILIILVPSFAIMFRRYHDVNKSVWWMFSATPTILVLWVLYYFEQHPYLIIAFLIISIILFIYALYLTFKKGVEEENKYGKPQYIDGIYDANAKLFMYSWLFFYIFFCFVLPFISGYNNAIKKYKLQNEIAIERENLLEEYSHKDDSFLRNSEFEEEYEEYEFNLEEDAE